jgi:penicillin-binding protein 1C
VIARTQHAKARITYPSDGTIFALDPDIPAENHAVFFEATKDQEFDWYLNDEKIADATHYVRWKPENGTYTLSIAKKDGKIIDTVEFNVRGRSAATR